MTLEPILAALFGWPLLILALGVYSITRLITTDTIIDRQRDWFFLHFPHEGFQSLKRPHRGKFVTISGGVYYVNKGHKLGELVHCNWCMGFWVSTGVCAAFAFWPVATVFVLVPLALRVVPGIIASVID